jgi:hypothetical protein
MPKRSFAVKDEVQVRHVRGVTWRCASLMLALLSASLHRGVGFRRARPERTHALDDGEVVAAEVARPRTGRLRPRGRDALEVPHDQLHGAQRREDRVAGEDVADVRADLGAELVRPLDPVRTAAMPQVPPLRREMTLGLVPVLVPVGDRTTPISVDVRLCLQGDNPSAGRPFESSRAHLKRRGRGPFEGSERPQVCPKCACRMVTLAAGQSCAPLATPRPDGRVACGCGRLAARLCGGSLR